MPVSSQHKSLTLIAVLLAAVFSLFVMKVSGQTTNASLSGIVADTTGAHIPGATVVLHNQNSGDNRKSVSNSDGVFNFSAVSAGTYTVTISYKGFDSYREKDIELHPGDNKELNSIAMRVGAENITIDVTTHDDIATDGEVSSLITADDIKHLATEGRDVTELVKILPGFALQPGAASGGGLSNGPPSSTEIVGPGGNLGAYSSNGTPANGIALISDGADVTDPGTSGASTQTINMDMVEEVKVSTSNFGADTAKGPVVINAVGKSGGQVYHGSAYVIGRTSQLNSNDWFINNQGFPKPHDRYIYPGFSIGGPIRIPGTNFNHDKKLLFLIGAEDYVQRNSLSGGDSSTSLKLTTVPTDAMRNGDFSTAALANLFNVSPAVLQAQCNQNNTTGSLYIFANFCTQLNNIDDPQGNPVVNGAFPAADIDPGAQAYLKGLFPHQNRIAQPVLGLNHTVAQPSDGFDRVDLNLTNHNLYQARGRIDYNFNQNNKFYTVYNIERGYYYSPYSQYGTPSFAAGVLIDPSLIKPADNIQSMAANYVRVFGPTLTNELFASAAYYFGNFNPINEAAQTSAALGYPYGNPVPNGSKQLPQLGYSSNAGLPLYAGPDFSYGQAFSRKINLTVGDNITKVFKDHTFKVGVFYERVANNQLSLGSATQGSIAEYGTYGCFYHPNDNGGTKCQSPNNTLASFLFGNTNYFAEAPNAPVVDLFYNAIDGYVTDSYKLTRKLTIDLGARFDHLGPWTDPRGVGPAYWFPQTYITPTQAYDTGSLTNAVGAVGIPVSALPGVSWHGKNSSVLDSTGPGRWAFVSPRFGFSYAPYGNGRTVFNGGAGMYRSHDNYGDYAGTLNTSRGSGTLSYNNQTLSCLDALGKGTANGIPACLGGKTVAGGGVLPTGNAGANIVASNSYSISVADPTDTEQPLTYTFSVGVNQTMPHVGNLLLNYVGNRSEHLLLSNGFVNNINTIPQGGLFGADPNMANQLGYGVIAAQPDCMDTTCTGQSPNYELVDDFRPYPFYNEVSLVRHAAHSNYNAMQVTLSRYTGHLHYNLNYTWSKALGERGVDGNGSAPDATNLRNDYGIAAGDRTNIFNASYTYVMGRAFQVNRFVSGFVNNWEISGITNLQSGPNLQAAYGNNFQLSISGNSTLGGVCSPAVSSLNCPTDSTTYLGTPDILLQPVATCDIASGLQHNQFINSACLTLPRPGLNGQFHYQYARGPAFFNSDLSLQKAFQLKNKKELLFRFAAFNFLNHPLTSLIASTAKPLDLVIAGPNQQANALFGISDYKQGRRVSEVTVRFNF